MERTELNEIKTRWKTHNWSCLDIPKLIKAVEDSFEPDGLVREIDQIFHDIYKQTNLRVENEAALRLQVRRMASKGLAVLARAEKEVGE